MCLCLCVLFEHVPMCLYLHVDIWAPLSALSVFESPSFSLSLSLCFVRLRCVFALNYMAASHHVGRDMRGVRCALRHIAQCMVRIMVRAPPLRMMEGSTIQRVKIRS